VLCFAEPDRAELLVAEIDRAGQRRSDVLFHAPEGPRSPKTSPGDTPKETPHTAGASAPG
jgi:hypothetical protein